MCYQKALEILANAQETKHKTMYLIFNQIYNMLKLVKRKLTKYADIYCTFCLLFIIK